MFIRASTINAFGDLRTRRVVPTTVGYSIGETTIPYKDLWMDGTANMNRLTSKYIDKRYVNGYFSDQTVVTTIPDALSWNVVRTASTIVTRQITYDATRMDIVDYTLVDRGAGYCSPRLYYGLHAAGQPVSNPIPTNTVETAMFEINLSMSIHSTNASLRAFNIGVFKNDTDLSTSVSTGATLLGQSKSALGLDSNTGDPSIFSTVFLCQLVSGDHLTVRIQARTSTDVYDVICSSFKMTATQV
jgi:hypothetical protein